MTSAGSAARRLPEEVADPPTLEWTKVREQRFVLVLVAAGTVLRALIAWLNHPANTYDNHWEPVFAIALNGSVPDKFACFQCYHPPAFYVLAAGVAKGALALGFSSFYAAKILQLVSAAMGAATIYVIWLSLREIRVSPVARVTAVAIVTFLPRHVYMSAMFSNDVPVYLFMAVCTWLTLRLMNGSRSWWTVALAVASAAAAIFTKYTAMAVLPQAVAAGGVALLRRDRGAVVRLAVAAAVPVLLLGAAMVKNRSRYGEALPSNARIYDPARDPVRPQPRDPGGIEFATFEPWSFVAHPELRPGQIGSFWTLLWAGAWFDIESYFGPYLRNAQVRLARLAWFGGDGPYTGAASTGAFLAFGRVLELIGFGLLALTLLGVSARAEVFPLHVLLAFTLAGVGYLVHLLPVYSAIKTSYVLGALPAFAALAALGMDRLSPRWRRIAALLVVALGFVVAAHVGHWALTMDPSATG